MLLHFIRIFSFIVIIISELKTSKNNIGRARRFRNIFRLIDYLIAINDGGEPQKILRYYLPELELKKENLGHLEGFVQSCLIRGTTILCYRTYALLKLGYSIYFFYFFYFYLE